MLAAGRRTIHHFPAGVYAQSGNREAQRRNVPHASLRRAHHRDALADAKAWRGTFPPRARSQSRRPHSRLRGHRRRSRDLAGRHAADSPGPRRNDVRGILTARARRDGEVRDQRSRSPRECRDHPGRLREPQRDAHRRPVRRSHRILFAWKASFPCSTWSASRTARIRSI